MLDIGLGIGLPHGGYITGAILMAGLAPPPSPPPAITGTTYYVDPVGGNDSNNGTSTATAWQNWTKVQSSFASMSAGDAILFKGGTTVSVATRLDCTKACSAANPFTFGSYGTGKATLSLATTIFNEAWKVNGVGGYVFRDLIIDGNDGDTNAAFIITASEGTSSDFWVWNVETKRCRGGGWFFQVNGSTGSRLISNITIYGCYFHDMLTPLNQASIGDGGHGISILAATNTTINGYKPVKNVTIDSCTFSTIARCAVLVTDADNVTIQRCVATATGQGGTTSTQAFQYGTVSNGYMRFNEAYANTSPIAVDGGGFDLDGGCKNCIVEWNYSHDNTGPGYLNWAYASYPCDANTFRYNISQNDGSTSNSNIYGGFLVGTSDATAPHTNLRIHNNVFYQNQATRACVSFATIGTGASVTFANNICYGANATAYLFRSAATTGLTVRGNDYYGSGQWRNASTNYATYALWRAGTSLETVAAADSGFNVDPLLVSPGAAGTMGGYDPVKLRAFYKLQPSSTMRTAGIDLSGLYSFSPGTYDAFAEKILTSGPWGVGADQPAAA